MAERKSGRGRSGRIKRIVVPIDFSERSAKALPYAAALAERFDASVTLMHVTEIPAAVGMDYIPTATAQAQAEQMAEGLLLRAQRESFPEGVSTRTVVKSGSAYHEITRTAQKEDADLIVLTTHGRTGLTHALLGSTAERVVRHSSCPVMVVREKASA
jgi:nucleotide-binding universal stress UspA family protein